MHGILRFKLRFPESEILPDLDYLDFVNQLQMARFVVPYFLLEEVMTIVLKFWRSVDFRIGSED
jgi:hypothetical protein